jgi:hypothetical protein
LKRSAVLLASWAAWLVACDVTLRFDGDAGAVDAASGVESGATCAAGNTACDGTCSDASIDSAQCDSGVVCSDGGCACPPPTTFCSGACFNLKSDHNHCGDCVRACGNGEHCASGQCATGSGNEAGP